MNPKLTSKLLAPCLMILATFSVTAPAHATDAEDQCFSQVQGKLPWEDNRLNWDAKNVKQLCKGTHNPAQPGQCFSKVRTERVNWGKGRDWEWKNIINLCSGTNDAEKTVGCFSEAVTSGLDWRDAILACQRSD